MYINSGGTATEIKEHGGYVYVASGANVTFASNTIRGFSLTGAAMTVHSNTIANSTTVNSGGKMYIYSGGGANSTTVNSGGLMYISSGGTATEIKENGGYVHVAYGANITFASNTISGLILTGASMTVHSNTIANSTTVNSGGSMYISSGGVANSTINAGGSMFISGGGTANATMISGYIYSSAGFYYTSGGSMYIDMDGTANSTTITSSGGMYINYRGVANSTTVKTGGNMYISTGGVANSTINAGGNMYISSGGTHRGSLQIAYGAVVSAYEGSIINFTVADRTVNDGYLINNLSLISGAPTYTITVSSNLASGTYKLAQGAENFKGSISIGYGIHSGVDIAVNGSALEYDDISYKLTLSGGNLDLTVDNAVLPVTDSPATDIKNRGFSQVIAWDKNRGTVGMIHNDGSSPAAWGGVWEWSGSDINLWRVAGAGHFKGSKVDYDGVLLYNGIGNTFAAWTDLNDPSYGYVDLCHVEGSFNTRAIADFDGNNYDDILIFDDKGSFGTVLDGTTYKDIWHVDNPASNPWKVLGAGSFGGKEDKLIVENSSNGHLYLWQNNDSSFKTWNWSQIDIGYLGKNSKFMVSGDFSGDGTDDIVIQKSNGEMWCWDDGNSANLRWIGNLDSTFAVESVGDYNADGKEDILLREQSSGWGGLGFWGAGYAGNWTDMNVRIETDTRISGSKFAIIA